MTRMLFRDDAYARSAQARVVAHTPDGGIVLDESLFYATGGGQPGDGGSLTWPNGQLTIAEAVKTEDDQIALIPAEPGLVPPIGATVTQTLDWDRRYGHMRVHTALHLLSVVVPLPVSGGSVGSLKGRIDFNMPEAPDDKMALQIELQRLIDCDLPVSEEWITETELDANPSLTKTMSVSPPRGAGLIRLVRIGQGDAQVDLQPCGGTHVAQTGEIGRIRIGKIEKKGQKNRRVYLHLET